MRADSERDIKEERKAKGSAARSAGGGRRIAAKRRGWSEEMQKWRWRGDGRVWGRGQSPGGVLT